MEVLTVVSEALWLSRHWCHTAHQLLMGIWGDVLRTATGLLPCWCNTPPCRAMLCHAVPCSLACGLLSAQNSSVLLSAAFQVAKGFPWGSPRGAGRGERPLLVLPFLLAPARLLFVRAWSRQRWVGCPSTSAPDPSPFPAALTLGRMLWERDWMPLRCAHLLPSTEGSMLVGGGCVRPLALPEPCSRPGRAVTSWSGSASCRDPAPLWEAEARTGTRAGA